MKTAAHRDENHRASGWEPPRIGQTVRQVETEDGERRPERIRLRTVILNLMYVAAIDGSHGGRKYLRFGRNCHRAKTFQAVFRRLVA